VLPTQGAHISKYESETDPPRSGYEAVIEAELAVLASIEARHADELMRVERSAVPPSVKEHLRVQLEERRKAARQPHVLRLAELHEQAQMRTLFSCKARH
jgi:hypothetical protein